MTLRHMVMWKLNGATSEERNEQAEAITAALLPLRESVPSVRALEVHRNALFDGTNYDLVLVSDFDDAEGLAEYATHPDHVAVIDIVKPRTAARAAVDFTL